MRLIQNSHPEISARLDALILRHRILETKEIVSEIDLIIRLLQDIKRAYIFAKHIDGGGR